MGFIQRFRSRIDRRFEKHPIIGYVIYGVLTGFIISMIVILLLLGLSVLFGLYNRLGINYRFWRPLIAVVTVMAILVLFYGAMAYFPYKRKGNSLFKKEYTNGTSYRALNRVLSGKTNEKHYHD